MQVATTINARQPYWTTLVQRAAHLLSRRQTIRFLVSGNLKSSHRDKALGHVWNLLDPLLYIGVYFFVFGYLFAQSKKGGAAFIVYLAIGVLVWRFIDGTISSATVCIRSNRSLIHEISFPKGVFPVSVCLFRLYDFIWALIVLTPIILIAGFHLTLHVAWVVPLLFFNVLFAMGVAFLVAYMGAFFADAENILHVAMRMVFYLSPTVYYTHGRIPDRYMTIYNLNPVTCFFEGYRSALLYGKVPDPLHTVYVCVLSVVVLIVGFAVFTSGEGRFAKF